MPTLEQLREWARGNPIDGLPEPEVSPRLAESRRLAQMGGHRTHKYKISQDGTDALLKFGRHTGKSVSRVVKSDRDYAEWLLGADVDAELKDVVKYQLQS